MPPRESAADVHHLEIVKPALPAGKDGERAPHRVLPNPDAGQLRADMQMQARPAQWPVTATAGIDRLRELAFAQAELARPRPYRQAGRGLRFDVGVEPQQHVEPSVADPEPSLSRHPR